MLKETQTKNIFEGWGGGNKTKSLGIYFLTVC